MNSLFIRLWLALWFAIVVVVILSVGAFEYFRSVQVEFRRGPPAEYLRSLEQDLLRWIEAGNSPQSWLETNSSDERQIYLLDRDGKDLNGRTLPEEFRSSGGEVGKGRVRRRFERTIELTGYGDVTLVSSRRGARPALRWFSPTVLIFLGFLVSGMTAVLLARYITFPIRQLKIASDQVAHGEFNTNVSAAVGNRKDELADLAFTFDNMSQALASAQTMQQTLLRDISHELRSPLARLLLTSELLSDAEGAEREKLQRRIKKDLDGLEQLISEVMTLARFDAEQGTLDFQSVDLVEALLPLFGDVQFEANALGKSVEFRYPDKPMMARVDQIQVVRAVENVVRNAIRHTPDNTKVSVWLAEDGEYLILCVQDQGPGVDESELEDIFAPFYRGAATGSTPIGTGVGLALVERILTAHGGRATAHNTPDSGLLVRLYIPKS